MKNGLRSIATELGFTLIEIMVVLAIIGGILVTIAPRLMDKKTQMKATVREFASTVREVHNAARLFNATYRIVIDINDEEGHGYSVESAPGNVSLMSDEQEKEFAKLTEEQKKEAQAQNQFSPDERVLKKPVKLPRGLFFEEVEFGNRSYALNSGKVYIHFLPQGLTEEAVIHITDKKGLDWTIALHPITGQADLFDGKKTLKELRVE